MNLRHIKLVIKREFMERLRSPGFIIGTILGVIGIAGLSFIPTLLSLIGQETALKVVLVDRRDLIYSYIPKDSATTTSGNIEPGATSTDAALSARIIFSRADTDNESVLSDRVKQGKIGAYVVVSGDKASNASFES